MNKNNTSGALGVSFESKVGKFRAYIDFKGTKFRLGYFNSVDEAVRFRQLCLKILHDTFISSGRVENRDVLVLKARDIFGS